MKLADQTIAVILTEEGKQVLGLASVGLPESNMLLVSVEEPDDFGLWIRLSRDDQTHFFLLRWEYVLGIDLRSGASKVMGLKGIG